MSHHPVLRVAMLGAGGIALTHGRHWRGRSDAQIVAIADADPQRAAALANALELPPRCVVADLDAVLARDEVHAVDVCTPPAGHQAQALRILAAGRHVILEKPLAAQVAGLDALLAGERASSRVVVPVLQNRLGLGPRQLRALIAAGACGRFLHASLETSWRRTAAYYAVPWRGTVAGELGGCMTGLAIHQLDLALEFIPPVRRTHAHFATLVHAIEVEDTGAALLSTEGGGWLTISCSVHAHRETSRLQFVYENVQVEAGPEAYSYAATGWRFTCADAAHQRRIDALLAEVRDEPSPDVAGRLWCAAARVWTQRCLGGPAIDPDSGARVDLASARPGLAALDAIRHAAGCALIV